MSPVRMSKIESAVRIVLEFTEAFNRHDVPAMMKLLSTDCVCESHSPAPDGTVHSGKEAVTQFWQDFFRDQSDVRMEVEEIFGLGLRCVARWKYTGLAGNQKHIRGVDVFQVREGLICEQFSYVKGSLSAIK